MPTNAAAWLGAKRAPLEVGSAPYTHPGDGELVIKNHAVAINPVDWAKQALGNLMFSWIRYPFVLGEDVAGEVVEVGTSVSRFRVGDRVLAHAVGTDKSRNNPSEGAFQAYTVVLAHLAAPVPDGISYEQAAVLPLALSTAACGLFQADHLGLRHPGSTSEPTGQTLLVWGGSTSVGSNAIQLAVAAGYEVVTTASPRNFGYVRSLGASQVLDYRSASVIADVTEAFTGRTIAGALAVGDGSAEACLEVVRRCRGRQFVSMASAPASFDDHRRRPARAPRLAAFVLQLVSRTLALRLRSWRSGVRTKFIFGSSLMENEVSRVIYEDFLPRALAEGRYRAAPPPQVVGHGLEHVQAGLDAHRAGVSASKVVVSL